MIPNERHLNGCNTLQDQASVCFWQKGYYGRNCLRSAVGVRYRGLYCASCRSPADSAVLFNAIQIPYVEMCSVLPHGMRLMRAEHGQHGEKFPRKIIPLP